MSSRPTPDTPQSVVALRAVTLARSARVSSPVSAHPQSSALTVIRGGPSEEDGAIPPPNPAGPYEVRIRRGVGGAAFLVGHDRQGDPMVELRVHCRHITPSMVKNMAQWCRDHDDNPLTLL